MKLKVFLTIGLLAVFFFSIEAQTAKSRTEPLEAGETAPDFSLADENGKRVTLSAAGKTVVLVFYRGYWCPFCARQLAELRGLLKADEDVALYGVSIDDPERSRRLSEKISNDGQGKLGFPLLSDAGHRTIDAYGLFDPAYAGEKTEGIPRPAIFILDKDRKILWARVETDYRRRPSIEEIRAALNKAKR